MPNTCRKIPEVLLCCKSGYFPRVSNNIWIGARYGSSVKVTNFPDDNMRIMQRLESDTLLRTT